MNRKAVEPVGLELAGYTWCLQGMESRHLGRLEQARIPLTVTPCPNTVTWRWLDRPGAQPFQELEKIFNISFEYGVSEIRASGPRFNARILLQPELRAEVEILRSAEPIVHGIIENVLRILMAYRVTAAGGLLLHSACIADATRAWLVFGHSGAGKSTCSGFAADAGFRVLSDDMNVLLPGRNGWGVCRVPFCGTFQSEYQGPRSMPIASISQLRQSDGLRVEPLSPATAVALLFASSAFVNEDPWRADQLLENCEQLVGSIPVNALYFSRDPGFLQIVTGAPDAQAVA